MIPQHDIQLRIERYGLLRSALRAVEASSTDANAFGLDEIFQQVRGLLAQLRAAGGAAGAASSSEGQILDQLDRTLDQLQQAIVAQIRSIRLSQLRATLPAVKRQCPEELKALLDMCLAAHVDESPWWDLIDYLITLLAYDEKNGRRYVARDPTRVTARLEELCAASERAKSPLTDSLARLFHDARAELERGSPAGPVVERMRSAKHQAMETLLVPELLRAIIAYNIAVSNQRADLIETKRVLEEAELEAFERTLGRQAVQPAAASPAPAVEPFAGSALESPALRAVVDAVRGRLLHRPPSPGPAAEIAAALDLSRLSAYEKSALRDEEPAPIRVLVSTAVCLGLIERGLAGLGEPLARLGVSAEQLRSEWIRELENRIQVEASELVSGNAYEEARRIAEVRTRLLHGNGEDFNAWRLERDPAEVAAVSYAAARPAAPEPAPGPARRGPVRIGAAGARGLGIAAAIAAAVASVVAAYVSARPDSKVAYYSERQLEKLSLYLESGYRTGRGEGPAFVGTLRPQWEALSQAEREASAREIEQALLRQGISEFMLFDRQRRLEFHYAQGRLALRRARPRRRRSAPGRCAGGPAASRGRAARGRRRLNGSRRRADTRPEKRPRSPALRRWAGRRGGAPLKADMDPAGCAAAGRPQRSAPPRDRAAFTLLELMLTLAIVGVLSAIAIPMLISYQLRSKAAEGQTNIAAIQKAAEAYYAEYNVYVSALPVTPASVGPTKQPWGIAPGDPHGFNAMGYVPEGQVYFQYGVTSDGATAYTIAARSDLDGDGAFNTWALVKPVIDTNTGVVGPFGTCPDTGVIDPVTQLPSRLNVIGPCDPSSGTSVY